MKKPKIDVVIVDELVKRFVDLCIAQDRELLRGDIAKINRLFDQIDAIEEELKSRPGDQRHALISLYEHQNMQVRLKAAKATLAIAPDAARRQLEEIRASNWQPQAGDAGTSLWNLDRGIYKPT